MKYPICPLCRFRESDSMYTSALGTTPICCECFFQQAEDPKEIAVAMRHIDAGKGNIDELRMILKFTTVCISADEGYISLKEYNSRMQRQLAHVPKDPPPHYEAIELANLDFIKKGIIRLNPHLPEDLPPRKTGRVQAIVDYIDTYFPEISWCLSLFSTSYCGCRPAYRSLRNNLIRIGDLVGRLPLGS